jgi:hypothetical protein
MFAGYGLGMAMGGMGLTIATAGSLITSDIVSKAINITIYSLTSTLSYMSESSENISIKKYHSQIESLDIEFKLNIIQNWLKNNDENNDETKLKDISDKNNNVERNETKLLIYYGIKDICLKINKSIETINIKIKEHHEKWFHTYRNLSLNDEIYQIKKYNKILNERIYLSILK